MSLFNLAFVRQQGGQFLLRVEDTDRARFRADSEQQVYDTLRWLGLDWDEGPDKGGPVGPYRQSERLDTYRPHVDRLLAEGSRVPVLVHLRAADRDARGAAAGQAAHRLRPALPRQDRAGAGRAARVHALAGGAPARARRRRAELRRPHPRRGERAAAGRPGAAQGGRVPDLPPGGRGRRPPHGDHARGARRGVDLLHAQAPAAVRPARVGAAAVRAHAAAAQRRQEQDLQAQEPGGAADLVHRAGLPAGGAAELPRAARLLAARPARGLHASRT